MRLLLLPAMLAPMLWPANFAAAQRASPPPGKVLTGQAAFGDWHTQAPGVRRHIKPQDLPPPYATRSASNTPQVVAARGGQLHAPPGFDVKLFAQGLHGPRAIRTAPNGDIFVAESEAGRIRVLRPSADGASAGENQIFASGLREPFGIAFYPNNGAPQWVYVANMDSVVRFPYRNGDLQASGKPEVIVSHLPAGGHWTRDIAFSRDGQRLFVSVGSGSNVAQDMPASPPGGLEQWTAKEPLGAAWGPESERADVLVFDPQGKNRRVFATGLRNCAGVAVHPATGDLMCAVNERDGLGNNLPPDYVTRVKQGAFYGWPWYYIGNHPDPRHKGGRPDLAAKVTAPDVLLQPHSAPLQIAVYDGSQFPADYKGEVFAALHGSWNREPRVGYKIVRVFMKDGIPTGEFEDFVTGFVIDDRSVWGRPVGVTVAKDGSLLFSEDGNGTVWRVSYDPHRSSR